MVFYDILGHLGNIGFIVGAIALAKKSRYGFHWQILGNVMYLIQAIFLNISSLLILCIILIVINIYGIFHWKKGTQQ